MRAAVTVSVLVGLGASEPRAQEQSGWQQGSSVSAGGAHVPRVRSEQSAIAALVTQATESSATFRRLVDTIDATDGIVYVAPGRCGRSVRACLIMSVQLAGPSRILRILIDPQKTDCEVAVSIGHELQHANEVLADRSLRSDAALFSFYTREGRHSTQDGGPFGALETKAALQVGSRVEADLRRAADRGEGPCHRRPN